jgi:hypothetical protein
VRADDPTLENDDTSRYRFLSQQHHTRGHISPEDDRSARRAILPPSARADSPWPLTGVSSLSQCQGQPEPLGAGAQDVTPHERSSQGVCTSENRAACHRHHLPVAVWRISKGEWPQPCAGDPPQDRADPRSPDAPDRPLPGRCGRQGGERWGTTRCQSGRAPCKKIGRFLCTLVDVTIRPMAKTDAEARL